MVKILSFLFPATITAIKATGYQTGYQEAIKDILVFKDKIYTQPVTLEGDHQTISNHSKRINMSTTCTFLGEPTSLTVTSR